MSEQSQQTDQTSTADAVEDAALWNEFDTAEKAEAGEAGNTGTPGTDKEPPEGRSETGQDGAGSAEETGTGAADGGAGDESGQSGTEAGTKSDDKSSGEGDQQTQADIWANATPEQRAAFEAAQTKLERLQHENRSNRKRMSDVMRRERELAAAQPKVSRETSDGGAGADTGAAGAGGFLESDDWKSFKDEYPEVAGPLEKVVGSLQQNTTKLEKELAAIGDDRRQDALDRQADLLREMHPDWEEVTAAKVEAFTGWLEHQPRHVREAAVRNANEIVDAEEAADVIGRFKAFLEAQEQGSNGEGDGAGTADQRSQANGQGSTGNNQARQESLSGKRQRQLESSTHTKSTGPSGATGIPEDGDPKKLWDALDRAGL